MDDDGGAHDEVGISNAPYSSYSANMHRNVMFVFATHLSIQKMRLRTEVSILHILFNYRHLVTFSGHHDKSQSRKNNRQWRNKITM